MASIPNNGKLTSSFTAHPKIDPMTGEMMFFGYSFAPPYLQYGVVSSKGELLRTVPIELPMAVMMHDFAITENYTIFMDLPLTFSPSRMQRGESPLMFEINRPSRFGIVTRHGDNSNIRWFETPACYVFHTLNAWEEGDEVVLIACRMNSTNVLMSEDTASAKDDSTPRLHQWRFNLNTGTVTETMLDSVAADFPRVNENFLGRQTRYGYAGRMTRGSMLLFDGIIKYDLNTNKSQTHEFESGCYGGEAVFAPHPDGKDEDKEVSSNFKKYPTRVNCLGSKGGMEIDAAIQLAQAELAVAVINPRQALVFCQFDFVFRSASFDY